LEHLLARRPRNAASPWIHTSDYQIIDKLLKQTAPASGRFNDRLFPEAFTARHLAEPGTFR
jgi:hypothetical protein